MEIVAIKRSGNGQTVCARCKRLGISYPVFWDSMLFNVPGLKGCFCSRCVAAMRADFDEARPFLSSGGAYEI